MFLSDASRLKLFSLYRQMPQSLRGHGVRVGLYMQILAASLQAADGAFAAYCAEQGELLGRGCAHELGCYHDIGKAALPAPLPATGAPQDARALQSHTLLAKALLTERIPCSAAWERRNLALLIEVAASHHENFDGSGYPFGLAGDAIPPLGRVCAVANDYEHLQSGRLALSGKKAVEQIGSLSGIRYDPAVVNALFQCEKALRSLKKQPASDVGALL